MELFNIIAVLVTLSALFSFINTKYLKIHMTIGLIVISLIMSAALMVLDHAGYHPGLRDMLTAIDFNQTMLVGMLSFLLFAGALHIDINDLLKHRLTIGIFATLGVACSTAIVGCLTFFLFHLFNLDVGFLHCLLFGALISPTDPIAVLGILKQAHAPKDLEVNIAGESLFNDGVGVVIFIILLSMAQGGHDVSVAGVAILFIEEVLGGIVMGFALGWVGFHMLKQVDQYQVEILITLALVTGGYALSLNLHLSGPIAVVITGLMIGNSGRRLAMSQTTRHHLDTFWELVDEILNALLFVLIGLEVLVISINATYLALGAIAIPIVLFARFLSIGAPVMCLKNHVSFIPGTVKIMTWGGLRGGISVALALSLPPGMIRDLLLTMTYTVVVFSLVGQGLTIRRFL